MDWFERLTGFREADYHDTRRRLRIVDGRLQSTVNGRAYAAGSLDLPRLSDLRDRARALALPGRITIRNVAGNVRLLHREPAYHGALFQVASQFNMLEMTGPSVTPEDGVTRYQHDHTQGPACAIAAGAATIFRNYFAPVGEGLGQTATRQLDGLSDMGAALAQRLKVDASALWTMRNGYALPSRQSLETIGAFLRQAGEPDRDALRQLLRIGLHSDVEVTDGDALPGPLVSQAFCSAMPVAYSGLNSSLWAPLARLILEAAYEATLLAGLLNAARGASNTVLLTRLGGGAFGNDDSWIDEAMLRALRLAADWRLDVVVVSYGSVPRSMVDLVTAFGAECGPAAA